MKAIIHKSNQNKKIKEFLMNFKINFKRVKCHLIGVIIKKGKKNKTNN